MPRELTVLTPEKVEITFRIAEMPSRAAAYLLDIVIVSAALLILMLIGMLGLAALHFPENVAGVAGVVFLWFSVVCAYGFGVPFHLFMRGQTLGKRIVGLRVMMINGAPITTQAAIIRQLMLLTDFLPSLYIAGAISMFLSDNCQRLGDMVAGTIVVATKRQDTPSVVVPTAMSVHREHPLEPHVGSVSKLNEADLRAIRALVGRYAELQPKVRERLYHKVWRSLATRLEFELPPGASPLSLLQAIADKLERDLEARQP